MFMFATLHHLSLSCTRHALHELKKYVYLWGVFPCLCIVTCTAGQISLMPEAFPWLCFDTGSKKKNHMAATQPKTKQRKKHLLQIYSEFSTTAKLHILTGNVGLPSENGILELIWHHCKFIIRRPVDSNGIVWSRGQLFPYARSIGSCRGWKAECHLTTSQSLFLLHFQPI